MTSALAPDPFARGSLAPAQGRGLQGQDHQDLRCPRSRRESPWSGGASSPAWRQAWQWPASRQGFRHRSDM